MMKNNIIRLLNILFLRGAGSGAAVLFTLVVARTLNTHDAGRFFLLFNIITIAAICFRWGLDEVIVRKIASINPSQSATRNDTSVGLIFLSHRRILIWAVFATVLSISLALYNDPFNIDASLFEVLTVIILAALIAAGACAARVQQGRGRGNYAAFFLNIFLPMLSLIVMGASVLLGIALRTVDIIITYTISAIVAYIALVPVQYGKKLFCFGAKKFSIDSAEERSAANKLGFIVLAQQSLTWGALLLIPIFYNSEIYKNFIVTQKLATLVSLIMLAVNFSFAPKFAALYQERKISDLQKLIKFSALSILIASVLASIFVLLSKSYFFKFSKIGGDPTLLLVIMLIGQLLFSLTAFYSGVLSMCRDEKYLLKLQISINLLGLIAFSVLCSFAGLEIACASFSVTFGVMLYFLYRRAGDVHKRLGCDLGMTGFT